MVSGEPRRKGGGGCSRGVDGEEERGAALDGEAGGSRDEASSTSGRREGRGVSVAADNKG